MIHRRIVLARRPDGLPSEGDFAMEEYPTPRPGPGDLLVENHLIAFTPGDRLYMNRKLPIGAVMRAQTVGVVIDSNGSPGHQPGDFVVAQGGWQDVCAVPAAAVRAARFRPRSLNLGVLGSPGLTAYFGLLEVGQPKPGETVVVSGSTGVVGAVVLQLARLRGCRTIAVASDRSEKTAWLREVVRPDAVVTDSTLSRDLERECPDGIDLFFDNVGGPVLEAMLRFLGTAGRDGARIVCCGMISDYNRPSGSRPGVRRLEVIINRRLQLRGFLTHEFAPRYGHALAELATWVEKGEVRGREEVFDGLDRAPPTFRDYMDRRLLGKVLIRLKDAPDLCAPSTP